jgi:hypothetical protein
MIANYQGLTPCLRLCGSVVLISVILQFCGSVVLISVL